MAKNPMIAKIDSVLASKGISKQDFYTNCKITSSSYSQWNTGKTKPTITSLEKIAEYLNVSAHHLLELYHNGNNETEKVVENEKSSTPEGAELAFTDMELLNAYKVADDVTKELIRRALGLK